MLKDSPVNPGSTKPPAVSRRVLVVDDNGDSADSLALLLKLDGHETAVAYNGAEAVRMAESFRPDVAILDIGLPILTGHHVAKLIRAQAWGRSMVLIALTGWGQGEDRRKSAETGIDFHLVKPADTDELRRLIVEARRTVS
ncbi:MAG: response regulator [Gemmatimonadota bacterium]